MDRDEDTALYVMSVAAELVGLHPQTLRLYERKGLLEPARSDGGNRRYSDRDLDRLRRIGELTAVGISLEGVRRILTLEDENAALRSRLARGSGASVFPKDEGVPVRRRRCQLAARREEVS